MQDQSLKLYIYIKNIVVEGTVSQIFDKSSSSFYKKNLEKKNSKNKYKVTRFLT